MNPIKLEVNEAALTQAIEGIFGEGAIDKLAAFNKYPEKIINEEMRDENGNPKLIEATDENGNVMYEQVSVEPLQYEDGTLVGDTDPVEENKAIKTEDKIVDGKKVPLMVQADIWIDNPKSKVQFLAETMLRKGLRAINDEYRKHIAAQKEAERKAEETALSAAEDQIMQAANITVT